MAEQVIWGIHVTGADGDRLYRERGMVGIGWDQVGELSNITPDREAFEAAVASHFLNRKKVT